MAAQGIFLGQVEATCRAAFAVIENNRETMGTGHMTQVGFIRVGKLAGIQSLTIVVAKGHGF